MSYFCLAWSNLSASCVHVSMFPSQRELNSLSQLPHIPQCPALLPMRTQPFPSIFHNDSYFSHALLSENLFEGLGLSNQQMKKETVLEVKKT